MNFVVALPYVPLDQYVPLARTAEELGFEGVQLADHVVMPAHIESRYPYSRDGRPSFEQDVPWPDPWVTVGAMAQATELIRFYTRVYVLPLRNPFLTAKAVGTAAALSNGRVVLGVGAGWMREEFELLGQDFEQRGSRMDEDIAVLRALWSGPAAFRGHHYEFDQAEMRPLPPRPVPIYIGGESGPALRRAARLGDGFMSVPHRRSTLAELVGRLRALRVECGRADDPFDVNVVCTDAHTSEDFAELESIGVTSVLVRPWGAADVDGPLIQKERLMEEFAGTMLPNPTGHHVDSESRG